MPEPPPHGGFWFDTQSKQVYTRFTMPYINLDTMTRVWITKRTHERLKKLAKQLKKQQIDVIHDAIMAYKLPVEKTP